MKRPTPRKAYFQVCSSCGEPHARDGQRYCVKCHDAYMRNWRKDHPLTPEQRVKDRARSLAGVYKRRGLIKQKPCCKCGSEDSQMHHPDYGKPLTVEWMCRDCHLAHHEELKAEEQRAAVERFKAVVARHVTGKPRSDRGAA